MNPTSKHAGTPAKPGIGQKWLVAILVLTFAFVLMPFLLWYMTTFSRPLSDGDISAYFVDTVHPRRAQHALSQVADRIMSTDPARRASAKQWYPQVIQLAEHGGDELRVTSAWVMGQDNQSPEFHTALLRMLDDSNPMVQRNAALSLVRFADPSGHDIILGMLKPYTMNAPRAGTLTTRLKPGDEINPGTLLAHLVVSGQKVEIRSEVPGTIDRWIAADNVQIRAGQPLVLIDPSQQMAWEALRALYLIGRKEDLSDVNAYIRGGSTEARDLQQQATLTAQAINARVNTDPAKQQNR